MGSGCGNIIVDFYPSSSGQLPVPVALDAMSPTLFVPTIHHLDENVNPQFFDRCRRARPAANALRKQAIVRGP